MTEREKMLAGLPYFAFTDELDALRKRTRQICKQFNDSEDAALLQSLFHSVGDNLILLAPFQCDYGENISIGNNVFINFNFSVLSDTNVEIGDNCYIGPNVQLYTAIHPLDPEERNQGINLAKRIKIGANCWIGGGAIVLPGVEICEGCTIGAGSVVTKNIPARSVAVGNPCRVIKSLPEKKS